MLNMLKMKFRRKFILFGLAAAMIISPSAGCSNPEDFDNVSATVVRIPENNEYGEPEDGPESEPENAVIVPRFPQYILQEEELAEPHGFHGSMHVVVGKNGYLYENGYINEYLGSAQKYVNVTDEFLAEKVETLKNIQEDLETRGIAFCFVISPSKAGSHSAEPH